MKVQKRNGQIVTFDICKIENAISKAFESQSVTYDENVVEHIKQVIQTAYPKEPVEVEAIQDCVENALMQFGYYNVAKAFILYREQRKQSRFIKERIDYMNQYSLSTDNAASSSETDANANVTIKNVANLEGEVYKVTNRIIQRQRMKDELNLLSPEIAKQYETDLNHHIIYTHDEASTPVLKQYCMAVSLYPLMTEGVGNIDGVTPSEPNDLQSFSGQITNLIFLLSAQCKGAVAVGEYFIALNYYVVKEFGPKWYDKLDCEATTPHCLIRRTVKDHILKAFKQFVWGVNQPAGNRSYQSPFTNISYYDKTYFESLFGEFYYPDGTRPEWKAVDTLQRMFMKWFNQVRLKQVLTFPVETFAMVHNNHDIIDQEYKNLCAEMYAEGHSFFTYISDSADSLASCCRLRNELAENTFSPTSGLTGVMTGSCNVITLNINRIVQDWALQHPFEGHSLVKGQPLQTNPLNCAHLEQDFVQYLTTILQRVYNIISLIKQCSMIWKTSVCLHLPMVGISISINYIPLLVSTA
ncbi:MAG: anaerobic ribonucleoside-triphosphate reductase [Phocaeicola massiliensis]